MAERQLRHDVARDEKHDCSRPERDDGRHLAAIVNAASELAAEVNRQRALLARVRHDLQQVIDAAGHPLAGKTHWESCWLEQATCLAIRLLDHLDKEAQS